jgi:hypothetical protein
VRRLLVARAALVVLSAAAMACGPAEPPPQNVTNNIITTNVFVSFTKEPERLPFDPKAARLVAASNQLGLIAGHAIGYQFDAALLPEYASSFQEELTLAIENTARDLDGLQKDDPEAFAIAVPKLTRIACTYDAVVRAPKSHLDDATSTLEVTVPARAGDLVSRGAVYRALDAYFEETLEKRYGANPPADVPAAEQGLYFRWLTSIRRHASVDESTEQGLSNDPRAEAVLRVTELLPKVASPELRARIDTWLLAEGGYFTQAYAHHPKVVTMSPPSSIFHRAEMGWTQWAKSAKLADRERLALLKTVFVRPFNDDREGAHSYVTFAFPGLDPMAMADEVFDEWARAGHPARVAGDDAKTALYQWVACPYEANERGEHSLIPQCEDDYYRFAFESQATKDRFLKRLLASNDPAIAENTIRVYVRMNGADREWRTFLWRGLEPNDTMWTAATKTLADEIGTTDDGALVDEARRLWKAYPERRGTLLYLLASVDQYGNGKVPWATWAQNSGGGANGRDLDRYLGTGPRATALLMIAWPALDKGFSRADVITKRLDSFMTNDNVRFFRQRDPYLMLQEVLQKMCGEHDAADVAKLRAFLVEFTKRHPSDEKAYSTLIDDARSCGGAPAHRASTNGVHDPMHGRTSGR